MNERTRNHDDGENDAHRTRGGGYGERGGRMTITPITVLSRIVDRKTGAVIAASIEQVSVPLADAPNDIAFSVGDVDMQADADGWYHIGGGKQVADNGESEVARG